MEIGLIRKVDIDQEMQQSYLDYAMSVIVSRALPDARDGLKPVQRRILYAMYDMGLRSDSSYKKSARIVGEVLGKYHPHGDMAVYESMARLAQDFSIRYPLVDGQGNFGSVDGDPPAAMRYTEARLAPFALEILTQLDRDTVNFSPNFDGSLHEPDVLPAAVPNLLVNGATGIAVGMATSIPPHNLGEVIDALVLLLHEWERMDDIAIDDLMKHIQGPDFPTGGIILQESGQNEILSAYATGRGRLTVRGRVQAEEMSRGRSRLIITELPYQVNKSSLIERIAELVREGNIEGIADLRDESDRHGMRIVIELKQGIEPEGVLRELYKRTPLQSTFSISLLALVGGEPHVLSLKKALQVYLDHRLEVVKRRSEYDLNKAKARLHILEGLRTALANLEEIIALIKAAPDVETARDRLMRKFKLSDLQAQAILDMQLRRLASLERKKIEEEYKGLVAFIKELEGLLKSDKRMRQVVETELVAMKETYGDRRRTLIVSLKEGESSKALLTTTALTAAEETWVGVTAEGRIARLHGDVPTSGPLAPRFLLRTNSHHTLYLAAEDGRTAAIAVDSIPETENAAEGAALTKAALFEDGDRLAVMFSLPPRDQIKEDRFVITATRLGMVKKTALADLPGPSAQRFVLARVNSGDALGWVILTQGNDDVLLATAQGMAIRFGEQEVRPMGLVAAGVNGIKLAAADAVVGAGLVSPGAAILLAAGNGKAWRIPLSEFPVQGRYGQGVQVCKLTGGARLVGALVGKITQGGTLYFRLADPRTVRMDEIEAVKRLKNPQVLVELRTGDELTGVAAIVDGLEAWGGEPWEVKSREIRKQELEPALVPLFKADKAAGPGKKGKAAAPGKAGKPPARSTAKAGAAKPTSKAVPGKAAEKPASKPGPSATRTAGKAAPARPESGKNVPAAPPAKKPAAAEKKPAVKPAPAPASQKTPPAAPADPDKPAAKKPKAGTKQEQDPLF